MKTKKILFFLVAAAVVLVCIKIPRLTQSGKTEKYGFLMDTQVKIVIYDKGDKSAEAEKCYSLIAEIDGIMNTYNEKSELFMLNKNGRGEASDELYSVIKRAAEISEITSGAFDVTVKPLSELWNFKNAKIPSEEEIISAKSKISYKNIILGENNSVTLKNGAQIDLGGIAKGYAADCAIELIKSCGIKNALVDIGGNLKFTGNSDKGENGFLVGVQNPQADSGIALGSIRLKDKSLVTGGIYERNFASGGKLYHHILNPKTGYPAENSLLSVSVISESSQDADAYATALMVMGEEKGMELVNSTEQIECIMVKNNNEILLSDGIEKSDFEIREKGYYYKNK